MKVKYKILDFRFCVQILCSDFVFRFGKRFFIKIFYSDFVFRFCVGFLCWIFVLDFCVGFLCWIFVLDFVFRILDLDLEKCAGTPKYITTPLLFNIFMNDINETVTIPSLGLYTDDTTQYTGDYSPVVLQHLINQDMERLSCRFVSNYLQANEDKTQAMILGNSPYRYELEFAGTPIDIKDHLKILGICLDNNLSFENI